MHKIGIIGSGVIAKVMAGSLRDIPDIEVSCVASRNTDSAVRFVNENCPGAKAVAPYEEILSEDTDLIYIATPNHCHFDNAMMCIRAGKNVLVEKPFAMDRKQAEEIFSEVEKRHVFVCEAMWTCFMPIHKQILEWIDSGRIGKVLYMSSNLGYEISHVERLVSPVMGGGSYPDLGVYTTNLAASVLGMGLIPTSCYPRKIESGVEKDIVYTLETPDRSSMSVSYVTMCAITDQGADIIGTEGRIRAENLNNYKSATLMDKAGNILGEIKRDEKAPNGYALEVIASLKAIENGCIETAEMPHQRSLDLMRISDIIREMVDNDGIK